MYARHNLKKHIFITLGTVIIISGSLLTVKSVAIPIKAWFSIILIHQAWGAVLDGKGAVKPWPWIDSSPVAKLFIPRFGQEFVVMKGVSGSVLAFTPGWHEGTQYPGGSGVSLISAHKDTHFSFLRHMHKGDKLTLQMINGAFKTYIVSEISVLQQSKVNLPLTGDKKSILLLSTCYPFLSWQAGGDMRFVVVAYESDKQDVLDTVI